jgi:gliding-associated putative ABC transporter substrate-binding component GldG
MKARVLKYSSNVTLLSLVVASILIALNAIAGRYFTRLDLTENKIFTLSPATRSLAERLDDVINVKVYMSKELPPQWNRARQEVRDFLSDFASLTHGNLRIRWIDPGEDKKLAQRVERLGVPRFPVGSRDRNSLEVQAIYFGMVVSFLDKQEVIPQINPYTLEYDLAAALVKLTSPEERVVALWTPEVEESQANPMMPAESSKHQYLMRELGKQYETRTISLMGGARPIPKDVTTLILSGPKDLPERAKYEIDQFLMRGGRLVVLHDPIDLDETQLRATPLQSNLEDMLAFYGARVGTRLVVEDLRASAMASWRTQFGFFRSPYPFWPKVDHTRFAEDHPVVRQVSSLTLPWTGEVGIIEDSLSEGMEATFLAKTSPLAKLTPEGMYDLMPKMQGVPPVTEGEGAERGLVLVLRGKFTSFYKGKTPPEKPENATAPPPPPDQASSEQLESSPETTLVVIPNSRFIQDIYLQRLGAANLVFFLNLLDWMTLGEELIGIRSRPVKEYPLKEISEAAQVWIKYLNIFGMSVVIIALGLFRYMLRRRRLRTPA